ncbi:MAG TPA: hypothetical protein VMU59_07345 [Caulobacteraceae bacterium]|nr:hypothetical protein [Caulobacteraceae bacterium]
MVRHIEVAREERSWAIDHDEGYLGLFPSEEEADAVAALLRTWREDYSASDDLHIADLMAEWLSWPIPKGA